MRCISEHAIHTGRCVERWAIASKIYFMTLYDAPSQANRVLESAVACGRPSGHHVPDLNRTSSQELPSIAIAGERKALVNGSHNSSANNMQLLRTKWPKEIRPALPLMHQLSSASEMACDTQGSNPGVSGTRLWFNLH